MLRIKRVYDPPGKSDGVRILVDRMWPRGLSKERAAVDLWLRDLAPSGELRKWFGHDPERWAQFRQRYRRELGEHEENLKEIRAHTRQGDVTLLYAARDTEHNNAAALREYLSGAHGPKRIHGSRAARAETMRAVGESPARRHGSGGQT